MTVPEGLTPAELTAAAMAARSGDQKALRMLLSATQGPVRRFCAHMVPGEDADDLVQETFLRAWRSLGGFRGDSAVTTWLLTIARRVCIEAVGRSARRRRADRSAHRPSPPVPDPSSVQDLGDLINRLDPDRREAFVLTQIIGLSYAETAVVAETELGTVRSRVARARAQLVAGLASADEAGSENLLPPGTDAPRRPTNSR
ncbi:MAG TPA: sigma-70 family RNA polymerase sigma factor [Acidimicrobiales bacterium]|nr:sigma-70 family RNA polymerase sigma factor [Acidimicrobiales bacterium]